MAWINYLKIYLFLTFFLVLLLTCSCNQINRKVEESNIEEIEIINRIDNSNVSDYLDHYKLFDTIIATRKFFLDADIVLINSDSGFFYSLGSFGPHIIYDYEFDSDSNSVSAESRTLYEYWISQIDYEEKLLNNVDLSRSEWDSLFDELQKSKKELSQVGRDVKLVLGIAQKLNDTFFLEENYIAENLFTKGDTFLSNIKFKEIDSVFSKIVFNLYYKNNDTIYHQQYGCDSFKREQMYNTYTYISYSESGGGLVTCFWCEKIYTEVCFSPIF
jgi:hypothetical protein